MDGDGSLTPYLRPASPGGIGAGITAEISAGISPPRSNGSASRRAQEEEAMLKADAATMVSVPQEVASIESRIVQVGVVGGGGGRGGGGSTVR